MGSTIVSPTLQHSKLEAQAMFGTEPFVDLVVAAIVYNSNDLLALTKQCNLSVERLSAAMDASSKQVGGWQLQRVSVAGTPVPGFEMLSPQPHVLQLKYHRQGELGASEANELDIWLPAWESLSEARTGRVGVERVQQGLTLIDPFPQRNFVAFLGTAATSEGVVVERFAPPPSAELSDAFEEFFSAFASCGVPFVHSPS